MRIIGCDLHAAQQTIAMLDCETGERIERTLKHEGSVVRDFYARLAPPVGTGPKKAVVGVKWAVREMEERYKKMSKLGVRNIDGYNARVVEAKGKGEKLSRKVHTGYDKESGEAGAQGLSGEDSYRRYGEEITAILESIGAKLLWRGRADSVCSRAASSSTTACPRTRPAGAR